MKIKTYRFATAAAVLLALCLVFVAPVGAADLWTDPGNFNATWFDAEGGTTASEYHIYDAASLAAFAEKVSVNASPFNFAGKTISLESSIDLTGYDWTPIGIYPNVFKGSFNGNGLTISNLTVTHSTAGLFGYVIDLVSIHDLTVEKATVTSTGTVWGEGAGVIVSTVFDDSQTSWPEIRNIIVKDSEVTTKTHGGGIIGIGYDVSITDCIVENCEIISNDDSSHPEFAVGGIAGMITTSTTSVSVDGCEVSESTISGNTNVAGLIGAAWATADSSPLTVAESKVSNTDIIADEATGIVNPFVSGYNTESTPITVSDGNLVDEVDVVDSTGTTSYTGSITDLDEIPETPATPSSSSSGTPTPGAYYNYPRTTENGGLVEFGTSKVVKSVTLPAGSNGKVNLHIDSTAYWPLSLDSEFTFDISVDNLGEGTSYISFKIAESKLTSLELTAADVGVYHNVNGEWVKLVVTYTIEDGNVIYTAETDSFSPFKLVIEEGAAVQKEEVTPSEPVVDEPVTPDVPQDVPGEVLPEIPDIQDEPETPATPAPVLGLLAALGAAVVLRRK